MDKNMVIRILKSTLIYLIVVMVVSFIIDVGFSKLTSGPFVKTFTDWLVSAMKITKIGVWFIVALIFAYYKEKQTNR